MGNTIRFSGLASGLDTESLVNAMLTPYQTKVDTSKQASDLNSMKKEAWKEINSKVYSFFTGKLNSMRLESSFNKSSISASVSGIIEAKKGSLPTGSHTIKVTSLAESANLETSRIKPTTGEKVTKDTKLSDLGIDWTQGSVKLEVSEGAGTGTTEIELNESMSISDVESALKAALPNTNVAFNSSLGTFSISSKETGESQSVSLAISGGDQSALSKLGFSVKSESDGAGGTRNVASAQGVNTVATYNGMSIDSESNTVELNGAEITLVGAGTTTLSSDANTDSTYNMIVEFVDAYNTLLEDINTLVYADANNSYKPLTDAQKEAMSEDEIELWNNKINASILRNDSTLKEVTSAMRQAITDAKIKVGERDNGDPIYMTMSSIGISTSSNWSEKGKLHIDETKLKAALEENPDAVTQLFAGKANETTGQQDGAMTDLYTKLSNKFKAVPNQKSSNFLFNDKTLDKTITSQKTQTDKLIDKMETMEEMYYARFTAMEKMLTSLNSQSSYFSSMLG